MKKLAACLLLLVYLLGLAACSAKGDPTAGTPGKDITESLPPEDKTAYPYVVEEITESTLLVVELDAYGNAIEGKQYSVPNLFYPSNKLAIGDRIAINHNGMILETFPMQFGQIYSMEYHDEETDCSIVVTMD